MRKYIENFQKYIMLWFLLLIGVCSLVLFSNEFFSNDARIVFLDVDQGDAILIITPNRRQILIDAGKYANISMKISKYMSISDRSLDVLIATHPDIDHIAGFNTLLDEYDINMFVHSGLLAGAPVYRTIANKIREKGISAHAAIAGEKIIIDKDMYLEILSPYSNQKIENPNDYSVVIRLVYNNHAVMLTGDASKLVEQNIVSMYGKNIQSDILKMGHHGSKTSSDENFVKIVNPKYGVISAACDNSFGHPHASVLQLLDEQKIQELSTCVYGDIIFDFINDEWLLQK